MTGTLRDDKTHLVVQLTTVTDEFMTLQVSIVGVPDKSADVMIQFVLLSQAVSPQALIRQHVDAAAAKIKASLS